MVLYPLSKTGVTNAYMICSSEKRFLMLVSNVLGGASVPINSLFIWTWIQGWRLTCMQKLGYIWDKMQINPIRNQTNLSNNKFDLVFF